MAVLARAKSTGATPLHRDGGGSSGGVDGIVGPVPLLSQQHKEKTHNRTLSGGTDFMRVYRRQSASSIDSSDSDDINTASGGRTDSNDRNRFVHSNNVHHGDNSSASIVGSGSGDDLFKRRSLGLTNSTSSKKSTSSNKSGRKSASHLETGIEPDFPEGLNRKRSHSLSSALNYSDMPELPPPSTAPPVSTLYDSKPLDNTWKVYDPVLFDILSVEPKELSQQLCLVDLNCFKIITPAELLSLAWNTPEKSIKSPQITSFTQRFNNLTLWVTHAILDSTNVKRRAEKIEYFIEIGKYCEQLNNFNSLKSILGALQSTPIHRLSKTWELVGKKEKQHFDRLSQLMSSDNNSEKYRKRLQCCKLPCVPYLGLYLSDLTFLSEVKKSQSNSDFEAKQKVDSLLNEIARFQTSHYDFKEVPPIMEFLLFPKFISELQQHYENENYRLSLLLEPKDSGNGDDSKRIESPTGQPQKNKLHRKTSHGSDDDEPTKRIERYGPIDTKFDDTNLSSDEDLMSGGISPSKNYQEGYLVRKNVTIGHARAKKRDWKKYYVLLRDNTLVFLKEKPTTQAKIVYEEPITYKSFVGVADNYKKRKNVFRFLPEEGTEIYLEAESYSIMEVWIHQIDTIIKKLYALKDSSNLIEL